MVGYFERLKSFFEGWFSRPYIGQNGPEFIGPDPGAKAAETPVTDADRLRQAAQIDTSGLRVDNTPVSSSNRVPVTIVRDNTPGGLLNSFMQWWTNTMPGFLAAGVPEPLEGLGAALAVQEPATCRPSRARSPLGAGGPRPG